MYSFHKATPLLNIIYSQLNFSSFLFIYLLLLLFFFFHFKWPQSLTLIRWGAINNRLIPCIINFVLFSGIAGSALVSQFLSTVISCERCFVVVSPFRAQTYMKTSTMAAIITSVSCVLIGGVAFTDGHRFAKSCLFDPVTNTTSDIISVTQ